MDTRLERYSQDFPDRAFRAGWSVRSKKRGAGRPAPSCPDLLLSCKDDRGPQLLVVR